MTSEPDRLLFWFVVLLPQDMGGDIIFVIWGLRLGIFWSSSNFFD